MVVDAGVRRAELGEREPWLAAARRTEVGRSAVRQGEASVRRRLGPLGARILLPAAVGRLDRRALLQERSAMQRS